MRVRFSPSARFFQPKRVLRPARYPAGRSGGSLSAYSVFIRELPFSRPARDGQPNSKPRTSRLYGRALDGRRFYGVTTAGSGMECLEAAMGQPFDLVLLDMLMPEPDGISTFESLRANPAARMVPVLLLTALAVEGHWEALPDEAGGGCFLIGKPYVVEGLLTRVAKCWTDQARRTNCGVG